MAPVGDAVGLIHHEKTDAISHLHKHLLPKLVVGETLRRDQQYVDFVGLQLLHHRDPFIGVGRVDGGGTDAQPPGRLDLIPHQREQGRDEKGGPSAPVSQQPRGKKVHHALAPTGALHYEQPRLLVDKRLYGIPLPFAKLCRWIVEATLNSARARLKSSANPMSPFRRLHYRSSTRRILPLVVLGNSSMNSIWRGYL